MIKLDFKTNPFATHQPVLYDLLSKTTGNILELGCGNGSTPIMNKFRDSRKIVTVESDYNWFNQMKNKYEGDNHKFIHTDNWLEFYRVANMQDADIVFIDNAPWEMRIEALLIVKDSADYIILHDADYYYDKTIKLSTDDFYINDFKELFRYSKLFKPVEFYPPSDYPLKVGPPTLICSNKHECDKFEYNNGLTEI